MSNNTPKAPPTIRQTTFDVINGERDYQDLHYPAQKSLADFANLLIDYTDKLAVDATVDPSASSPAGGALKRLREIAAIAVHAMEVHGVQPRENHVPPSAGITGVMKVATKSDGFGPGKRPVPTAWEQKH